MDFNNILQYLQGFLTNQQSMAGSQFGQNLGLQQQALAQQGSEFGAQLGQQGSEFNSNLALEKQKQDEANQLAQQEFGLQQGGQQFQQQQQAATQSLPYLSALYQLTNPQAQAAQQQAAQKWETDRANRINASLPWYLQPRATIAGYSPASVGI